MARDFIDDLIEIADAMTKIELTGNADKGLSILTGKAGLLIWRLTVLALLALGYFEGKNMLNAFISQTPAMVADQLAIAKAQEAVVDAKTTAVAASGKVDQVLATQTRIFDALKQGHEDIEGLRNTVTASNATVTAQITALGKQVDRIETKQDAQH